MPSVHLQFSIHLYGDLCLKTFKGKEFTSKLCPIVPIKELEYSSKVQGKAPFFQRINGAIHTEEGENVKKIKLFVFGIGSTLPPPC
jgi:hypothetical protein